MPVAGNKTEEEIDCAYFDVFQMFLADEIGGRNTSNRYRSVRAYQLVLQARDEFHRDRIGSIIPRCSLKVKARLSGIVRRLGRYHG